MSDEESDLFEDAIDAFPNTRIKNESTPVSRPNSLTNFPRLSSSKEYTNGGRMAASVPARSSVFSPQASELTLSSTRRERLRGLRNQMRDEFERGDGPMVSSGDGDTLSLISENTSLHSWHRRFLACPSSVVVHPTDSISTCAMSASGPHPSTSPPWSPAPSVSPGLTSPEITLVASVPCSPLALGSPGCSASSMAGPPPSHPPPPLPTTTHSQGLRSPPPVPPRNPSIRLPKPLMDAQKPDVPNTQPVVENKILVNSKSHEPVVDSSTKFKDSMAKLSVASTESANSVTSNGESTPQASSNITSNSGRRRGHAKTNSLDRGLTLAKTIKTGPFPPPANKSNSLTRGQGPPEGACDGEEDERNQEAEGVISQLTVQLITEHSAVPKSLLEPLASIASESSSPVSERTDSRLSKGAECKQEKYVNPSEEICIRRMTVGSTREAKKSETIVEESGELEPPPESASEPVLLQELHIPTEKWASCSNLPDTVVDPITRDVERRMSMKGHGQIQNDMISDDGHSDQFSPTSRFGHAKSVVKGYASGFFKGAFSKARTVAKAASLHKVDADHSASDSEDGGETSVADAPPSQGGIGPNIVRPRNNKKGPFDFDNLRVAQELKAEHTGAVWCVRFSVCGRLMATAGQDAIIRVWVSKHHYKHFEAIRDRYMKRADCPPQEMFERAMQEDFRPPSSYDSDVTGSNPSDEDQVKSIIFMSQPFVIFKGHTADVLDLSWSKNNFVLSSGMDRTVKLWHITRTECLCCFQHVDFVTCVAFLPKDDRYFLSGSLDGKLRLWHIPDKKVAVWNEVQVKFITALAFVKNGKFAVVGTYIGRCYFYTSDQLKYHTVVDARSTRGKNARGHKVTGLAVHGDKLLVTSNDSRIRMYDVRDMSLTCKFIGAQNEHSQIRAAFSPDGKHIVCGSEDKYVYMWRTGDMPSSLSVRKDRNGQWERARTHVAPVCVAVFAPKPNDLLGEIKYLQRKASQQSEKERAVKQGEVIISADLSGCIKVMVARTKQSKSGQSTFFNGVVET